MTVLDDITSDLSILYDADFGFVETVTGPTGSFLAVFDNEYYQADADGVVGVRSAVPAMRCRDTDALAEGATVTIRTVNYTVVEPQPNGYGETIHLLRLA